MNMRVSYETMQFFEMDVPCGMDAETYLDSEQFLLDASDMVRCGLIEFTVERILSESETEES